MKGQSVLVAGAGIAGPTLAYWLREAGFDQVMIEGAPHFRTGGYMIDFWSIGFEVADRMGLIPRLREVGYHIDRVEFIDAQNRIRSQFGGDVIWKTIGDQFVNLPRGDLARAIVEKIEGKVETIFNESVTRIDEDAEGVTVHFEHAAPRRFDLVVGCDGLHSAVRGAVLGQDEKFEQYLGYYTASFLTEDYPARDEHAYLSYAAPGRQISRYALRDNRTVFFFVWTEEKKLEHPDGREVLRKRFARDEWREIPEILRRLETCDDLYFDSVSQIHLPSWSKGRCALVGDAAYCPSLLAGEGSAFAMAGAYILAGELAQADGDYARAFRNYEASFRPFIERKQKSAAKFARSFAPRSNFGLFVRDQVLRLAALLAPVAQWLMNRFVSDRFTLPDYRISR